MRHFALSVTLAAAFILSAQGFKEQDFKVIIADVQSAVHCTCISSDKRRSLPSMVAASVSQRQLLPTPQLALHC